MKQKDLFTRNRTDIAYKTENYDSLTSTQF